MRAVFFTEAPCQACGRPAERASDCPWCGAPPARAAGCAPCHTRRDVLRVASCFAAACAAAFVLRAFAPGAGRVLFRTFAAPAYAGFVLSSAALPPLPGAARARRLAQCMKNTAPAAALCAAFHAFVEAVVLTE